MLSLSQAEIISEQLLTQQRVSKIEAKNAAARRVPRAFNVAGLDALEPWERAELASQAAKAINKQWAVACWNLSWFGLCVVTWYALGSFLRPAVSMGIFAFVCPIPIHFIRAYFVRGEIRKQLASRNASRA